MRNKPLYNNLRLIYKDLDGVEHKFYCDEVSTNKRVSFMLNMPVKDSGARYITSDDIDFEEDGEIIEQDSGAIHRILSQPEIRPIKDNNSRRGKYRRVKIIETS